MKTNDYIKKYGLDKNNKSLSKLEKDEFFKDLEKELLERIQEREGRKIILEICPTKSFRIWLNRLMINSGQSQIRKKGLLLPSNYGMPFL